ncbi:DUF397 domain-containing protein [Streptomyces sp. ISL-86]|uniref:DUF397 domain-containing protein n=1 Tax=Streptomyces sp. ISL-86 TaxID=2819187 RepID=UPI001BE87AF5|nr:DUF397 domain-containing protein [Streptomyces sp. ISL-86]MBT2458105.1 DUF397 domain-containing protein [Streptomyces sp. ISL-86]
MTGIVWQRSSFCGGGGNNCVEIAELPDGIAIRDSVYPDRLVRVGRPALSAFLACAGTEVASAGLR